LADYGRIVSFKLLFTFQRAVGAFTALTAFRVAISDAGGGL